MQEEKLEKKKGFFARFFGGSSRKAKDSSKMSAIQQPKSKKLQERFRKRNRKFVQQVDTNIVSIGFDVLEQDAQIAAGDPIF